LFSYRLCKTVICFDVAFYALRWLLQNIDSFCPTCLGYVQKVAIKISELTELSSVSGEQRLDYAQLRYNLMTFL